MKSIRYVGKKDRKEDNVAQTGVVWEGKGDVQPVPDNAVPKLLMHPDIWELATEEPVTEQPSGETKTEEPVTEPVKTDPAKEMTEAEAMPPLVNLESMDKAALKDFAQRQFGHEFHPNTGEAKMRQTIIGMMNRG